MGSACGLEIDEWWDGGSIAALLSALRPGGAPAVQELHLFRCAVWPAGLANCTALASVTHLWLADFDPAAVDWDVMLPVLLRRAPLLSSLHVTCCFQELPQCVTVRTGLRRLTLNANGMQTLPAGPYLAGLEHLSFTEDSLVSLPATLTACTALTSLELEQAMSSNAAALPVDNLAALLLRLPQLRRLQLACCGLQQLHFEGWTGISALSSLDLSLNGFATLPAALSLATSLRQLSLSGNTRMGPTAQQLRTLLSRLPLLEQLDVSGCGLTELPERFPPGKLCR